MYKICTRCGAPIKANKDLSDVFEDMHWLCFHLEYEHGDFDPDEACDDPSCPWNRISGMDMNIIYSHCDMKILSSNNNAGIFISKQEIELYRLPCIKVEITISDEYLKKNIRDIWIEEVTLHTFSDQIKNIWNTGRGTAVLKAMTEEDFSLKIMNVDNTGHIIVIYKAKSCKYVRQLRIPSYFESGFEIDFSVLEKLINDMTKMLKLFE